jgi:hypothetical protein
MPTTHSAYDWLRSKAAPRPGPKATPRPESPTEPAVEERGGREEITRLHREIADLVTGSEGSARIDDIDSALSAVARLQVVSANLDANKPPRNSQLARALVELADRLLYGRADAVERGMTYTADNQMRLLLPD